jgi:hypothetical protein
MTNRFGGIYGAALATFNIEQLLGAKFSACQLLNFRLLTAKFSAN